MSLINDMLRDLDRRGAGGSLPAEAVAARPVPRRRTGAVITMVAALLLIPAAGWLLLQRLPAPSWLARTNPPAAPSPRTVPGTMPPAVETPESPDPSLRGDDGAGSGTDSRSDAASTTGVASSTDIVPSTDTVSANDSVSVTGTVSAGTTSPAASSPPPVRAEPDQATVQTEPPLGTVAAASTRARPQAFAAPAAIEPVSEPAAAAPTAESSAHRQPSFPRTQEFTDLRPAARPATAVVASAQDNASVAAPTAPLAPAPLPDNTTTNSTPTSRLSIRRHETAAANSTAPAGDLLQQARDAVAARRGDEALHLLQLALARDPEHHQARLLLAGLQAERGLAGDAIATLEAGLALDARQPTLAEALGRLHLQQRDPVRAAAVLAAALPPLELQPGHHALLALAWQQAGQPDQAARVYQSLVAHDSRVGAWWLGLGLARDTLGDKAAARAALQQAERAGGLADGVLRYVRQRIGELGTTP